MTRYLSLCKYSPEAYKGLSKDPPLPARHFLRSVLENNGSKMISMDWVVGGDYTVALISEGSRDALVAISSAVIGSGVLLAINTFELMSSAEMDNALSENKISYRLTGQ